MHADCFSFFSLKENHIGFFVVTGQLKRYLRNTEKRKKESTYHSLPQILMSHPCAFALW